MPDPGRTDTLQYLDPRDVIADYKFPDFSKSYSGRVQSLKPEQIARLGGMMVWDVNKKQAVPLHREQVGWHFQNSGIDAALTGTYRVKLLNGREMDAMPIWQMYLVHLQDYDLDTVHQITRTPKDLLVRWARDSGTIKPAAIHNGEGTSLFPHDGNGSRRRDGAHHDRQRREVRHRLHTWSGNYKAGIWNATPWSGAGLAVHTGEDPFNITTWIRTRTGRKSRPSRTTTARKSATGTTAIRP
jgi:nitrate reductase / nitrite oxidoreductase, alpha subunit